MKETFDVVIREAVPDDAENILAASKQIGSETDYLVMDEDGMELDVVDLSYQLAALYESSNNILLTAILDERIIGIASVKADHKYRVSHIGEVGISIMKEYWGLGLGSLMLEELIDWAKASGEIRRLELVVQARNQRAVHLYEKLGFKTEATMERGARNDNGYFLDTILMSKMID